MPRNNPGHTDGQHKAGADLSAKQFYLVKLDANGDYVLAAANTDVIAGVLLNKPTSGQACDVALIGGGGVVQLVVDGGTAIAIGDRLTSDASGRGLKSTTSTHTIVGTAEAASTVTGDIIDVMLGSPQRNI